MRELLRSPHFVLTLDEANRIVSRLRTSVRFETLAEVTDNYAAVARALDALDRPRYGLFVDLRQGPARNDPEYEAIAAQYSEGLYRGFRSVAVVVLTAAGNLQLRRFLGPRFPQARVFSSEDDARTFLTHSKGGTSDS